MRLNCGVHGLDQPWTPGSSLGDAPEHYALTTPLRAVHRALAVLRHCKAMSTSEDFASRFDSISVERAVAFTDAPEGDDPLAPGYTLLDDANGRFAIERETGIVSVLRDDTLASDAGRTFAITLRCVERSGMTYTQTLQLRVTGRIPQIVGDSANDALSTLGAGPLWDDAPIVPARRRVAMAFGAAKAEAPEPAHVTRSEWSAFAAFCAHVARQPLNNDGAFGALLAAQLPPVHVDAALGLGADLPPPAPAHLSWAL